MPDEDDHRAEHKLEWRDYVALFIAMLQTVALPMLVLIVIILAALAVLGLLR